MNPYMEAILKGEVKLWPENTVIGFYRRTLGQCTTDEVEDLLVHYFKPWSHKENCKLVFAWIKSLIPREMDPGAWMTEKARRVPSGTSYNRIASLPTHKFTELVTVAAKFLKQYRDAIIDTISEMRKLHWTLDDLALYAIKYFEEGKRVLGVMSLVNKG
jgi:hypothetical protein